MNILLIAVIVVVLIVVILVSVFAVISLDLVSYTATSNENLEPHWLICRACIGCI